MQIIIWENITNVAKLDDAKIYLLKAKDSYVDLGRSDKVEEVEKHLNDIEKEIEDKENKEHIIKIIIIDLPIAMALAVIFAIVVSHIEKKYRRP